MTVTIKFREFNRGLIDLSILFQLQRMSIGEGPGKEQKQKIKTRK